MSDKPHLMIVEAPYYEEVAKHLRAGVLAEIEKVGATHEIFAVPGALEIPAAIQIAIKAKQLRPIRRRFDGYIALGCVLKGETKHFDIIAEEAFRCISDLALQYTLAIGNGILTCYTMEQALERARIDGQNKGGEAARACLGMLEVKRAFKMFPRDQTQSS